MHARRARLDNGRWHFQHGPIDLVIGAEGDAQSVAAAHESAWVRFRTVLPELVAELSALRQPVRGPCALQGAVARRMWGACRPFHAEFITPMAAVAGSVAQEIVAQYAQYAHHTNHARHANGARDGVQRAWVNNGGDIALHLGDPTSGASVKVGVFADLARFSPLIGTPGDSAPAIDGDFTVHAGLPVRGIATSGWRGRSFSLGIADSVTVLARTAAMADAAATVIANAVNVADPCIVRRPASEMKDDSDLGELEVTVDVPPLEPARVLQALQAGRRRALELQRLGLIHSALLVCQHRALGVEGPGMRAKTGAAERAPASEVGSVFA